MVDTIAMKLFARLLGTLAPKEWSIWWNNQSLKCTAVHKATGIRLQIINEIVVSAQASLPRLLFGSNGVLIKDQSQLSAALSALKTFLSSLMEIKYQPRLTRIDLVWQFVADPLILCQLLRNWRLPHGRRDPREYYGTNVVFRRNKEAIQVYDKGLELYGKSSQIARCELQCRHLSKFFDVVPYSLDELHFTCCYAAYRKAITEAFPSKIACRDGLEERIKTIDLLVAVCVECERQGHLLAGMNAAQFIQKQMTPKQVRGFKTKLYQQQAALIDWDWAEILPLSGPPTPIDAIKPTKDTDK